jgi:putative ABC transport system ATP-binding protein
MRQFADERRADDRRRPGDERRAADTQRTADPGRSGDDRRGAEQRRPADQRSTGAQRRVADLLNEDDAEEDARPRRKRFGRRRGRAPSPDRIPSQRGSAPPDPRTGDPELTVVGLPQQRRAEPAERRPVTGTDRAPSVDDATALYKPAEPIRDAVLSTLDLVKVYGHGARAVTALDGITLDVARCRFTAIMGASGSGKSTLLHCLAGLDTPTRGKVMLGTTDLTRVSERKLTRLRRDRIGFVFQSYDLLPQLTVQQNILLPIEVAGAKVNPAWQKTVLEALELGDLLRQLPAQLSGGEQQRVAVARAVLPRPDVVLADEPTGALDAGTTRDMVGFLRASVDHLEQTVVMVTHDPLAAQHTDRAVILHEGRLVGEVAQPTAHGVLDALAALADHPARADSPRPDADRRPGATGRRADRRGGSRLPLLRRRAARDS